MTRPPPLGDPTDGADSGATLTRRTGRRIRVLQIAIDPEAGGLERVVADLTSKIDADSFERHLLCIDHLGRYGEPLATVASVCVGVRQSRLSLLYPRALAGQIRGIRPDVVHVHSGAWFKAAVASRLAKVPRVLFTDHGRFLPEPWSDRLLTRLAARRTDSIIAVSTPLADYLRTLVPRYASRIRTIVNGIDAARFHPATPSKESLERLGVSTDQVVIGTVGRLEPVKRYDVLIRAHGLLVRKHVAGIAPALVIAGDGPERGRLERVARQEGTAEHVRFTGWVHDPEELYRTFAVFALSSETEGTSISLLEAMSTGICPVVTNVGGNPMVLGDSLRHRLVPGSDPSALACAIEEAIRNPVDRANDGREARTRVLNEFSLEIMIRQYEDLYRRLHAGQATT